MTIIHVTDDDIGKGNKNRIRGLRVANCPVAVALNRQVPQAHGDGWRATDVDLYIWPVGQRKINYHSPRSVQRFIHAFDANKPVKPFSFILRLR